MNVTISQKDTNQDDGHENGKDEKMEQMVRHQMSILIITNILLFKSFVRF